MISQKSRIDTIISEVIAEERKKEAPIITIQREAHYVQSGTVDGELKIAVRGTDRIVDMIILPIKSKQGKFVNVPMKALDDLSTWVEIIHGCALSNYMTHLDGNIVLNAKVKPEYIILKEKDTIDAEFKKRVDATSQPAPPKVEDVIDLGDIENDGGGTKDQGK